MNKISRLFLVFLLTITTIFAVSACTKKEDNQDKNTIMTEEPGIPLETYLNGNYKNITIERFHNSQKITLKPSKHPKRTRTITDEIYFNFKNTQIIQKEGLKIRKYQSNDFGDPEAIASFKKTIVASFTSSIGFFNGYEAEYSISFYKNGKNIYTNRQHKKTAVENIYRNFIIDDLQNIKESGTYIFHFHHMTHVVGHWDAESKMTYLKDHVFAFQIGDGDDVG